MELKCPTTRYAAQKVIVLFLSLFLFNSSMAQLDNYPFITLEDRDWLIKKNFDADFYFGTDSLINDHLTRAIKLRKNPLLELFIKLNKGTRAETAFKSLRKATIRRYDQLLGGQTFLGSELFRNKEAISWYRQQNFHVEYYDGQSPEINQLLDQVNQWRKKANNHWDNAIYTNGGGIAMVLGGAFFAAFGDYEMSQALVVSGAVVHLSSYVFAISAILRKDKARRVLNKASRALLRRLNQQ